MKRIYGISLIAMLAVIPTFADAAAPTPLSQNGMATINAVNDQAISSTGYVKGAYNASMNAVNTVVNRVNSVPDSVVETINDATVSGNAPVDLSGVTVNGDATIDLTEAAVTGEIENVVTQGSVTVPTVTGATGTVQTVTTWGSDVLDGTAPVTVGLTTGTQNVGVTGTSVSSTLTNTGVSGISVGTANLGLTGTATANINGLSVSVDEYNYVPYSAPATTPTTGD